MKRAHLLARFATHPASPDQATTTAPSLRASEITTSPACLTLAVGTPG
ncbi:hypothetical protein HMPREF0321_0458 [Dermacoccus sp. Ellin185]|nr:hypothetical protein HMPREF0321_0458 [Dermacoccus sp. Ellin185]